jgi:hypothetical protein
MRGKCALIGRERKRFLPPNRKNGSWILFHPADKRHKKKKGVKILRWQ